MRLDLLRTLLCSLLALLLTICPTICCGADFECHDPATEIEPHGHAGHGHGHGHGHEHSAPLEEPDDHPSIPPAHSHALDCICHGATASPATGGSPLVDVAAVALRVPTTIGAGRGGVEETPAELPAGRQLRLRLQTLTL